MLSSDIDRSAPVLRPGLSDIFPKQLGSPGFWSFGYKNKSIEAQITYLYYFNYQFINIMESCILDMSTKQKTIFTNPSYTSYSPQGPFSKIF